MSNVSIFEKKWINIVFENRNKEYGAYKLRQESPKTTLFAFLLGITFLSSFVFLLSSFGKSNDPIVIEEPFGTITPIDLTTKYKIPKNEPLKELPTKQKKSEIKDDVSKKDLVKPEITKSDQKTDEVNTNLETKTSSNTSETGSPTGSTNGNTTGITTTLNTGNTDSTPTINNPIPTTATVDVKPDFPGGMAKFYKYVGSNFERLDLDTETVLTVYVSFVVEIDGSLTDIKAIRNPGYGLDKEAIRVLKSLKTKWIPGKIKGQPVRTQFTLPIKVQAL